MYAPDPLLTGCCRRAASFPAPATLGLAPPEPAIRFARAAADGAQVPAEGISLAGLAGFIREHSAHHPDFGGMSTAEVRLP